MKTEKQIKKEIARLKKRQYELFDEAEKLPSDAYIASTDNDWERKRIAIKLEILFWVLENY